MGIGVGTGVGIRLLGPLVIEHDGKPIALPRSRKVRALFGYLALAPRPVSRSRLCDLFWDAANDPRGELRWSLSKLRSLIGDRVVASDDNVSLDLGDCTVDVHAIDRAVPEIAGATRERLDEIASWFGGDLLDGLVVDASADFTGWLVGERRRYRTVHIEVLEALAKRTPPEEMPQRLEAWLRVAPFDTRAHEALLATLVRSGRGRDADEHLAAAIRTFEQEGLDWTPLRDAMRAARMTRVEVAAPVRAELPTRRRASVAVMPFVAEGRVGDGLTEDIITQLAKLRVLFVIARGTVYALSDRQIDPLEAGRILNVEYVVSGRVRRDGDELAVAFELAETQNARIVWTDELRCSRADVSAVVERIVAAIAEEIETAESQRAVLKPPSSLDAWEAYHRGLWHMYKFNGADNRDAERFFRASLELDPTFARAHAGLSFTHFQNAFLDLTSDRDEQIRQSFAAAEHSVSADDRDPAAHWAMGRALWLRGAQSEALAELRHSVELSPNFALGHYTLGFVQCQQGDPKSAIDATDYSRKLSPFDPLQFAMLASRAIAHIRLGEYEAAADWAVRATTRPNAHAHILGVTTLALELAGRADEAHGFVARLRNRLPSYGIESFLRAFRFAPDTEALLRRSARAIGFE